MALRVEFHADAIAEFEAAVDRYEAERRGLGAAFAEAVHVATARAAEAPASGLPFSAGTRRIFVLRFPYAVIYAQDGNRVLVVAIAHFRRRPGYWRRRV